VVPFLTIVLFALFVMVRLRARAAADA
jgi:hypothetical protein